MSAVSISAKIKNSSNRIFSRLKPKQEKNSILSVTICESRHMITNTSPADTRANNFFFSSAALSFFFRLPGNGFQSEKSRTGLRNK